MANYSTHENYTNLPVIGCYQIIKDIGFGTFSTVHLAQSQKTDQLYALKIIDRDAILKTNSLGFIEQELRLVSRLSHPNIVKIYDTLYLPKKIVIVMEYCEKGELLDYINSGQKLSEEFILRISHQIISALAYLHSRGIAHRDIKPENIVFDSEMNAKLIDFGASTDRAGNNMLATCCGTLAYLAPEVIDGSKYDGLSADMWSFGITLYVMATGVLPWEEQNMNRLAKMIKEDEVFIPFTMPYSIRHLIEKLLQKDPKSRATAESLLTDEVFDNKAKNMSMIHLMPCFNSTPHFNLTPKKGKFIVRPKMKKLQLFTSI